MTAYGFGTRRRETAMLDVADFGRNPDGQEFGDYGVCYVRYGKTQKGSPPKRRSVLTVWEWTAEILEQWFTEVRPTISTDGNPAAWPSERGVRVGMKHLNKRLAEYRDETGPGSGAGLPLAAPRLCHTLDRGRLGSAVRAGSLEPAGGCPRRATRTVSQWESAWWRWLSAAFHHADSPEVRCLSSGC
jgi:hypothetical protein